MSLSLSQELLTVEEMTSLLKVNRRTIYRMLESGELPFALKIKGSWRFRAQDVDVWLESCKVNAPH